MTDLDDRLIGRDVRAESVITTMSRLSSRDPERAVRDALLIAKEHLGMDVSYISRITETEQIIQALEGDSNAFGFSPGKAIPVEGTYCRRMLDREIPNVIPDTSKNDVVAGLEITREAGIGAYLGVPLVLSDGHVYGSLCCVSQESDPSLGERDQELLRVIAHLISDALEREQLLEENWRLRTEAISASALMSAVNARDGYTAEHCDEVLTLALETARELQLSQGEIDVIAQVALLHDIGKIGIPDAILHKGGALDGDEWAVMRTHPAIGEAIISAVEGLAHLAPMIRGEHENWDGSGYPDGLKGDEIPLASRVVLVCDAYHAMISDRPYRKAMSVEAAAFELTVHSGTQFDPRVVDAFLTRPGISHILKLRHQLPVEMKAAS